MSRFGFVARPGWINKEASGNMPPVEIPTLRGNFNCRRTRRSPNTHYSGRHRLYACLDSKLRKHAVSFIAGTSIARPGILPTPMIHSRGLTIASNASHVILKYASPYNSSTSMWSPLA